MEYLINLRDLFTKNKDELPDWINLGNVIYKIVNKLNGDSYIGQAKWFYGRFVSEGFNHYDPYVDCCKRKYNSTYLYNALRKYGCRNFDVIILEYNISNLNEREIYWIAKLHTFYKDPEYSGGYNMTSGGENCECMHTEEAAINRANTNIQIYGSSRGSLGLRSSIDRAIATKKEAGNGDCMYMCHNKESVSKMVDTQYKIYGHLACNTEESTRRMLETQRSNNGGILPMNSDSAINKQVISRVFYGINLTINYLIDNNLDLNLDNYYKYGIKTNINTVKRYIIQLINDSRWTNEMTTIFNSYIKSSTTIEKQSDND